MLLTCCEVPGVRVARRFPLPLEVHSGIEVLILKGSPAEMGAEHGVIMRERIQLGFDHFVRRSEEIFEVPYEALLEQAGNCEPHIPQHYIEEMKALASGCGIAYNEILALNCLVDIDACFMQKIFHCCNFAVGPPATQDGIFLHGRNLDFPHLGVIPQMAIVIVRMPTSPTELPTVGITWVGFVGMLTGCNATQLTLAEVGSPAKDCSLKGIPIAFLLRKALEECSSTQDVYRLLGSNERTCGFNVLACDGKTGESSGIEFTHSLCERRPPRRGILVVDDVCLCGKTGHNRLSHPAGAFRHARMMQLIHEHSGKISLERALAFLKDRYDMAYATPRGRGYNCICNRDTVHSVLFVPAEERLLVAHGHVPAPKGEYKELKLNEIW